MINLLTNIKNNKLLFFITLFYFLFGFINIHFALLGLICMMLPFILLFKHKRKIWCQGYCPRASLYTRSGRLTSQYSLKTPRFFTKGGMKWIILFYFGLSLFFITITTVRTAMGIVQPMNYLRFFIIFSLEPMPQLISFTNIVPWMTHLAYRFYSMMMTTTLLGLAFALVYKPRTWCTVCPVGTLSDAYVKSTKKNKSFKCLP